MDNYDKHVLCVQAHPDDTESWCAGLLVLMKMKGYSITIASMTDGRQGGIGMTADETAACRYEEAHNAAVELGADFHCLGGIDGFLYDTEEMRMKTIALIRRVRPGIVLSHVPFDYHSDHRTTGAITETACQLSTLPNVKCGEVPLDITPLFYRTAPMTLTDTLGFPLPPPHFYLDISHVMEAKMAMLSHHQSQIDLMKIMHGMDNFFDYCRGYNREIGEMAGVPFAELYWQQLGGGFKSIPLVQDILKEYVIDNRGEKNE